MINQSFGKLWHALGARGKSDEAFQFLQNAYRAPGRYYHNLDHIQACLDEFEPVAELADNPDNVRLAIWFHDVVYDVFRGDNEEKSADCVRETCIKAGIGEPIIQEVYDLILFTKHNKLPETLPHKIMVDVDLSILGKPQIEYDHYEKAIRQEYAHVPENAFRKGRSAILQSFLNRPSIYCLDYFINRYQQQAVYNLKRAIAALALD